MAGSTIYLRMLTFQWESRLGMVKIGCSPVVKLVASPTISRTIYFKLPAVYIVMTVSTLLCETHKLPVRVLLVFLMAGCAVGLFVYPLQYKSSEAVIKSRLLLPGFGRVATLTILRRVKTLADLTGMYIVVAINAPLPDISELPTVFL
jgi:hypothetical protein